MLNKRNLCWLVAVMFFVVAAVGCASIQKSKNIYPNLFEGGKANIVYDIAPEAEITSAKYFMAPWKGKDYLPVSYTHLRAHET